jgi:hypothetical protein
MNSLKLIASVHTLVITALAVISTWICRQYELTADFPMTPIATAVIFPIVFSIGGAYKRREAALAKYASIKAHGRAIFFAARDWLAESDPASLDEFRQLMLDILKASRSLFASPLAETDEREKEVYRLFSNVSLFIKKLRAQGLASGEASRCNQFLSKMIIAFEDVKHIYQYRTPRTLRTYSRVFIYLMPILYGPYFAIHSKEYASQLAYLMPVLFSMILASLDNIQNHLENPFDQVGEDDVHIRAEKFAARLEL